MSRDSFVNRDKKLSPSHRRAPKQEKMLSERFKGRRVPGSGSGHQKGDVQIKGVARIEAKTTKAKSFSVTRKMIHKITEAGMLHDEVPVLVIEFVDERGKPEQEVVVMPMYALEQLIARLGETDG